MIVLLDIIFIILGASLSIYKVETEKNQIIAFLFALLFLYLVVKLVYTYSMWGDRYVLSNKSC